VYGDDDRPGTFGRPGKYGKGIDHPAVVKSNTFTVTIVSAQYTAPTAN